MRIFKQNWLYSIAMTAIKISEQDGKNTYNNADKSSSVRGFVITFLWPMECK